jgi:large subunit ribosomal protein L31
MREGIHPNYVECTVTCACGNVISTRSTKGSSLTIDICSNCHPFYTGKQKTAAYGGRVEKFQRKYQKVKQA